MRTRHNVVFVSSVLFTIVFVWAAPTFIADARTWRDTMSQQTDQPSVGNFLAPVGFASLAIILIGLTVTWTGYLNRIRWAWLVMSIIVWVWAFPLMILPIIQMRRGVSLSEWFWTAIRVASPYRDLAVVVFMFSLLVIALILPIKSFFSTQRAPEITVESAPAERRNDQDSGDVA